MEGENVMEWIIEPLATPPVDGGSGSGCIIRSVDVCVGPASKVVICGKYN